MPEEETLGASVRFYDGTPDWWKKVSFDVAILGAPEVRNASIVLSANAPDVLRKWLYGLRKNSGTTRIGDLGNVKGKSINDRYIALREVTERLIEKKIFVLVIGGSQDLSWPAGSFLKKRKKKSNIAIIDALLDVDIEGNEFSSSAFIHKLLDDYGDKVDEISVIGTQLYFCPRKHESYFNDHFFPVLRLKNCRGDNIDRIEVVLRDTEMMSFDFTAIKHQPGLPEEGEMPNGFTGSEACRIFWYAGASDVMTVAGLFNMNFKGDKEIKSAPLAAQMIWHFLEGRGALAQDYPFRGIENYEFKIIYLEEYGETISFFFNPVNDRWWIEVPNYEGTKIVACHSSEYQSALNKELPDTWWRHFQKTKTNQ